MWDPVLNELRDHPDSPASITLAAVLRTPLMVALARTLYSDTPDHDPSVLLDTDRFPTPDAIEDHLVSNFIPTVYRYQPSNRPAGDHRCWEPECAQRWLRYLAQHLDRLGTRDLAWWQLGNTLPRSLRMLAVGLVSGLAFGLVLWLGFVFGLGDGGALGEHLVNGLVPGLVHLLQHGLVSWLIAGLAIGLVHGLMAKFGSAIFEPSRVRIQLRGGPGTMRKRFVPRFMAGFGAGLVGGLGVQLTTRLLFGPAARLPDGLMAVLVFMAVLVLGFALGLTAWLVAPVDIRSAVSPADLLSTNRTTVVLLVLMFGLGVGLMTGLAVGLVYGLANGLGGGLVSGFANGLVNGFGIGLGGVLGLTAWGQWVVIARIWLPLTGRLPWAVLAFLDDAYQRGVLRQAGAVYQFRHARLQDHLSRSANQVRATRNQPGLLVAQ